MRGGIGGPRAACANKVTTASCGARSAGGQVAKNVTKFVASPYERAILTWLLTMLGLGLHNADHHEDALSVYEAELAMERRLGAPEGDLHSVQANLANAEFRARQCRVLDQALRKCKRTYTPAFEARRPGTSRQSSIACPQLRRRVDRPLFS